MNTRKLLPHEAALHRTLRLAALKESPNSFGQAYDAAVDLPMSYWEDLTRAVTKPNTQIMVIACVQDEAVGSVYGLGDRDCEDVGHLGGMWVHPDYRRRGAGAAILEEVLIWARARCFRSLELWAPQHEPGAVALYERFGFSETGERRPFPLDADLEIMAMALDLNAVFNGQDGL